jgi:hypothetical protein
VTLVLKYRLANENSSVSFATYVAVPLTNTNIQVAMTKWVFNFVRISNRSYWISREALRSRGGRGGGVKWKRILNWKFEFLLVVTLCHPSVLSCGLFSRFPRISFQTKRRVEPLHSDLYVHTSAQTSYELGTYLRQAIHSTSKWPRHNK